MKIGHTNIKKATVYEHTEPVILSHPHIPKPLHGLNPRTIKGTAWWDRERRKAYASTNYHCLACGIHKTDALIKPWLEAHEFYRIDYPKGIVTIERIVPLCHMCHRFIHSGNLLNDYFKGIVKQAQMVQILTHGVRILEKNNLEGFAFTIDLADQFKIKHTVKPYSFAGHGVKWGDWKLVFDGVEYPSKFKDVSEWHDHYMVY